MQDRFLCQGIAVADKPGMCVVLATTIAHDPALAEAFTRFREFHARLTNPPRHVAPGSPAARCLSFTDITAMFPTNTAAVTSDILLQVAGTLRQRYGRDAGFALVAYAASKEYDLLQAINAGADTDIMGAIITAIRNGTIRLEPKPDSGWYDYQWYALETLVLPERAGEARKLVLSKKYRSRLQRSFVTSLTKHLETHIRILPSYGMGGMPTPEDRVTVRHEFSAEPMATMYLRYARGYRFVANAMGAIVGKDAMARIALGRPDVSNTTASVGAELRKMCLLCYGIYDRLCLELGTVPAYLANELTAADLDVARTEEARWFASVANDPDLAEDTRVAVPMLIDPQSRSTRFSASGGVRLDHVIYTYVDEPRVSTNVAMTIEPAHYYLPADIYLEFSRPGTAPLTREEFRRTCDRHATEDTLRAVLGAQRPPAAIFIPGWMLVCATVVGSICLLAMLKRRVCPQLTFRTCMRRVVTACAVGLVFCLAILVCSPYCRTVVVLRYFNRIPMFLSDCETACLFFPVERSRRARVEAAIDVLSDSDPNVRLAALGCLDAWLEKLAEALRTNMPSIETALRAATDDEVPMLAVVATYLIGEHFKDSGSVDFLLAKPERNASSEELCISVLLALRTIGDTRALDAVRPFTEDARPNVRRTAIRSLGHYPDERAVELLAQCAASSNTADSMSAVRSIFSMRERGIPSASQERFDHALMTGVRHGTLKVEDLEWYTYTISNPVFKAEVYAMILNAPASTEHYYRRNAADDLADLGSAAQVAIPALSNALNDANEEVREAALCALSNIVSAIGGPRQSTARDNE